MSRRRAEEGLLVATVGDLDQVEAELRLHGSVNLADRLLENDLVDVERSAAAVFCKDPVNRERYRLNRIRAYLKLKQTRRKKRNKAFKKVEDFHPSINDNTPQVGVMLGRLHPQRGASGQSPKVIRFFKQIRIGLTRRRQNNDFLVKQRRRSVLGAGFLAAGNRMRGNEFLRRRRF